MICCIFTEYNILTDKKLDINLKCIVLAALIR